MAPPRTVMRQTDDTVSSGLRQLLASEREYVKTLRNVDARLATRLRFCGPSTVRPKIGEWLTLIRVLATFHANYATKLQRVVDEATNGLAQVESVIEDLLLGSQAVYAPLHVGRSEFKEAIDAQLKLKNEDATQILRDFLQASKLTSQQLISLPLKHLNELLESVDIIVGSLTLARMCKDTKKFLEASESDAKQEAQLVELDLKLRGSPLETDLCGRKLLCRSQVTLSPAASGDVGLSMGDTALPLHDVYCLDDGTVLFIEKKDSKAPEGLCINLKNDAVFHETVPRSLGDAVHAIVLVGPSSSLLVSLPQESSLSDFHAFVDCVTMLLSCNETRKQQLKTGRSVNDLDLPDGLNELLRSPQRPLVAFPCFHDDELPGMFWMRDTTTNAWRLVELAQCDQWLLVLAVSGWRRHHLIHRADLTQPSTTVTEEPRDGGNWALAITDETRRVDVVAERRARIDFWSDQVSKAIEAAAAERKKIELQEAKAAEAAAASRPAVENATAEEGSFINVRAKKRQRSSISSVADAAPTTEQTQQSGSDPATKPTSSKKRKNVKNSTVDDAVNAAQQALAGENEEQTQPDASSTASSAATRQRTPPVKTPKQRWVRRKTDDPNDEQLEKTQPGEENGSNKEPAIEPPTASAEQHESNAGPSIRIIFTGIEPSAKTFKKISAIPGAAYEDNIEKATHVIAPKDTLKRTVKLLCGISTCDHILDERWLDESARTHTPVYARQYCLKDAKAEAKWNFDLVKTMYDHPREQRSRLFQGRRFYITPHRSILPPVQDLVKIVEQAGGSVATSGPPQDGDLVITSEAAVAKVVAKTERVYTPELILSSILQQRLDLDQHKLVKASQRGRGSRSS